MPLASPSRLLLKNARVASFQDTGQPYGLMTEAVIAVEGDRIAWLGPQAQLPANWKSPHADIETHDLGGRLVTPGLIDCHTHLVFAGDRSAEFEHRLQGVSYAEIAAAGGGILATVRATREASEEQLYEQSANRLKDTLAEGVTGIEIKSGYGLDEDSELKMLRVARRLGEDFPVRVSTTFLGAHALPPEYANDRKAYIDWLCQRMIPRIAEEKLADAVDAFCEHIGFTPEETRRVFDAAVRHDLPVKLHADQLSDLNGAALVAEYCGLSADHVEYTNARGVKAMAEAGSVTVLLPYAFYCLGETRKPPVAAFRQHQVPMAVATDCNPGTAPTTSLLTSLNMACVLFGLTPEEALAGATTHAARALGWDRNSGQVANGMRADLAIWNVSEPAQLLYWRGASPLHARVFAGAWLGSNPAAGGVSGGTFEAPHTA